MHSIVLDTFFLTFGYLLMYCFFSVIENDSYHTRQQLESNEHVVTQVSRGEKLISHLIHNLETEQNIMIYFSIFLNFVCQGWGGGLG